MRFTIERPNPVPLIDLVSSLFVGKNIEKGFLINFFINISKQQIMEYLSVHYSDKKFFFLSKWKNL
jgi:hypothetical protein